MKNIKYLFISLLYPLFLSLSSGFAFAQSALIKPIYLVTENNHVKDTIKSVSAPYIYFRSKNAFASKINRTIKVALFNPKKYDTSQSLQKLLQSVYKNLKGVGLSYAINLNREGLLSLTILTKASLVDSVVPLYLNFDLTTGNLLTMRDFVKSKNDSISLSMAIVPIITDSVRLFEVSLNPNNPKHNDIVEYLNNTLGDFRHHYTEDFILTKYNIYFCFNCILPSSLMPHSHIYRQTIGYKTLRNIFKPEMVKRLLTP